MSDSIEQQPTPVQDSTSITQSAEIPVLTTPQSEPLTEDPLDVPQETQAIHPEPVVPQISQPQPVQPSPKSFLTKALESIQFRKKAKLEKIIKLANDKKSITNDQVQKLLRISDATATRYLSELVHQNKLKRTGTTTNIRYEPTLGSNGGN